MDVVPYLTLFVLVLIMGGGIPGPGDAALIVAGTLAGDGRLNVWVVLGVSAAAWMIGSVIGFWVGLRGGRLLLERGGWLRRSRAKLLVKGDREFGRHTFVASSTLPAFLSGIFRVRFPLFLLGAGTAGVFWIGTYVGLSYLFGAEIARRVGQAGTRLILLAAAVVAVGLAIRFGLRWWRGRRAGAVEEPSADPAPA